MATAILGCRTFVVVTGASRGLGRGLAIRLAGQLADGSHLVLLARDGLQLENVKKSIKEEHPNVGVSVKAVDLAKPNAKGFKDCLKQALDSAGSLKDFDQAMIIHNAGTLGNVTKLAHEMHDVDEWREYLDLNLNSVVCLNSAFLDLFPKDSVAQRTIVNITSLAALHPFKSWAYYCTGKAAREMFFRVLAAEDPSLRVVSYSPGPLKTEMTIKGRDESAAADVRQWMKDAYDEGRMLDVDFTVERFLELLRRNTFQNGDHVDVEDLEEKRKMSISA